MPVKKDDFSAFDNAVKQAQASKQPTSKEIDFSAFDNAVKKKGNQTSLKESQDGVLESTTPTTPKSNVIKLSPDAGNSIREYEHKQMVYKLSNDNYNLAKTQDVDNTVFQKIGTEFKEIFDPTIKIKKQEDLSKATQYYSNSQQQATLAQNKLKPELDKIVSYVEDNYDKYVDKTVDGLPTPSVYKINQFSKSIAKQFNTSEDGYFQKLLYNQAKAAVSNKIIQPQVDKKFKELYKKETGKDLSQDLNVDIEKKFTKGADIKNQLTQSANVVANQIGGEVKEKVNLLQYDFNEKAKAINNDVLNIKNQIESQYAPMIKDGKFIGTPEQYAQYQNAYNLLQNKVEANKPLLENLNKEFIDQQNIIRTKANSRYRRQIEEISRIAQDKYNKEYQKFSEQYQRDPKLKQTVERLYKQAYGDVISKNEELKRLTNDVSGNPILSMTKEFLSSLGGSISGISANSDFRAGEVFGDYLQGKFDIGTDEIKSFTDLLDPQKLLKSGGQLAGGMAIPLIGTAASVALARGAGAGAFAQAVISGAMGWVGETADMAGRMKEDVFAQTGDIAKAENAAGEVVKGQRVLMPLYALEGLPFMEGLTKFGKNKLTRALIGGALEYSTELPQEYLQNLQEEAIKDSGDYKDMFKYHSAEKLKNTALQIAPVFALGAAGQLKEEGEDKAQIQRAAKSFALKVKFNELAPTQKKQFLFDMIQRQGIPFSSAYLLASYTSGNIDKATFQDMSKTVASSENVINKSKQLGLAPADQKIFSAFSFQYDEVKKMHDEEQDPLVKQVLASKMKGYQAQIDNFVNNKKADYSVVTYPNNEQYVFTISEMENALNNPAFAKALRSGDIKVDAFGEDNAIKDKIYNVQTGKTIPTAIEKQEPLLMGAEEEVMPTTEQEVPTGKELPDTQIVPTFEQIKLQIPQEDLQSTQDVITRMNNAEEINEGDISKAEDGLYKALEAHPESAHLIEPLINKLNTYELTTKTETSTVTEKEPIAGTGKVSKPKAPVNKSLEQWEGNRATVTDANGKQTTGILRKDENGSYSLFNENGDKIASIGEAAITDRDISLPSQEDVPMPIELDNEGMPKSITLQLNKVNMEAGGVEPTKTIKIEFKDKERALDLAIQLRAEQIGEVPDAAFEQAYNEVQREIKTEVPKYTEEEVAKKKEAIYGKEKEKVTTEEEVAPKKEEEGEGENKAKKVGEGLLTFLGVPTTEPVPQATKVYTIDNINEVDNSGYTGDKKFVIDGIANVVKAINKLVGKSIGKKLTVHVHDGVDSFRQEVYNAMIRDKASKEKALAESKEAGNKGFYASSDGSIHLNMSKVTKDTLLHEGFHPILDYMANNSPDVINDLHAQLVKITGKDITEPGVPRVKTGEQFIQKAEEDYTGEITQKKEAITDFIAQVASGRFKIDPKDTNTIQKVRDFFMSMLRKLGLLKSYDKKAYDRLMNADVASIKDLRDLAKLITEKFATGEEIKIDRPGEPLTESPIEINTTQLSKIKTEPVKVGEHKLSFVKASDLFDIEKLLRDISSKKQKVWFWTADQLGRGMYFDKVIDGEHYLDAGASYALDPKNREKGIIWATGKSSKWIQEKISQSDYIFIISGSPEKSKLFNKQVFDLFGKRIKDYNKFKKDVLKVSNVGEINDILKEFKTFEDLKDNPKRKDLLILIDEQKSKKTPLVDVLNKYNAFIDLNELRDGFYADNDFKMNDIMLVLKPESFGGESAHSTYENDVLGKVIGVPDRKINAYDLLPSDIKQKYESESAAKNEKEDIVSASVNVAPLYSTKVTSVEQAELIHNSELYKKYKENNERLAKMFNLEVVNQEDGVGGYEFSNGEAVMEATTVVNVKGKFSDIVNYAAVNGALTPEVQDATIAGMFVEPDSENHNADRISVTIDNVDAAMKAAEDSGFDRAGFTLINDEISFFNVFYHPKESEKQKNITKEFENKISIFEKKYQEYGGKIINEETRAVRSEYIDNARRRDIIAEIKSKGVQYGQDRAGLRDALAKAEERNTRYTTWKYLDKSETATEYRKLRQLQFDLASEGKSMNDAQRKRISELEKRMSKILTTTFKSETAEYDNAKLEVDAIASDVAKLIEGGYKSEFPTKRPTRAAIKSVRWYNSQPNLLGDGARANVIVNTDVDADFLFNELMKRFPSSTGRTEKVNTELGYPKRLIEIKTSNGKLAEVQVMTPQGYLAKDGVKDFPSDAKPKAEASLKEVRDRLGWNIPDGVGHYFYEINRDTNIQKDLREQASEISNKYYDAFLNPESKLSDAEFRKDVSDFKQKIDAADKSKWDEGNTGKSPDSLNEYLGEAEAPTQFSKEEKVEGTLDGKPTTFVKHPEDLEVVNGFYSPIEKRLLEAKATNLSANKWKEVVGKGDEAKFTGVLGWLESLPPTQQVSKSEIQKWMKDNRIEISEVVKEKVKPLEQSEIDTLKDKLNKLGSKKTLALLNNDKESVKSIEKEEKILFDKLNPLTTGLPKHESHQLPGEKSNYKEVLVTLPRKTLSDIQKTNNERLVSEYNKIVNEEKSFLEELDGIPTAEQKSAHDDIKKRKETAKNNLPEDAQILNDGFASVDEKLYKRNEFISSHYDEPNILAHIRMNTRVDAEGNKVLHIEEFQSDWGQKGRKEGFVNESDIKRYKELNNKILDGIKKLRNEGKLDKNDMPANFDDLLTKKESEELDKLSKIVSDKKFDIPQAPFVSKTADWTKLAWKVALKEAVKEGADKITWTTGEQQNDRYDLRKQVDEVNYYKTDTGDYHITGDKDGKSVASGIYKENELEGILGKEVAKKIIDNEGEKVDKYNSVFGYDEFGQNQKYKSLKGDDLAVGGKGMIGFYGSPSEGKIGIVGEVAKALFKQEPKKVELKTSDFSAGYRKIKDTEGIKESSKKGYRFVYEDKDISKQKAYEIIEGGGEVKAFLPDITSTQHSIDITPEMKAEVEAGLPQFSKGKAQESQIKEYIDSQRKAGVSEEDIRAGIESVADKIGLDAAKIDSLMSGEVKPEVPTAKAEPKSGTVGITKKDIKALAAKYNIEIAERREAISDIEIERMAKELIANGYDVDGLVSELLKAEKKGIIDIEANILAEVAAEMKDKIDVNSSDADIKKYRDVLSALNKGISENARGLRMAKVKKNVIEGVADVMADMMEDNMVDTLTPEQRKDAEKRYSEIKEALDKETKLRKKAEAEIDRLKAKLKVDKEVEVSKEKPKKEKADYKAEKESILKTIKEKWQSVLSSVKFSKEEGTQFSKEDTGKMSPEKLKQLMAIAPEVNKLIKGYIEQNVASSLDEVKKVLKKDIEDAGISVTDDDINNLIAGNYYKSKKNTKAELNRKLYELKQEQKLLMQIEAIEAGEVPTTEKKRIQKNQRLTELRKKIEELTAQPVDMESAEFIRGLKARIAANVKKQNAIQEKIDNNDFTAEEKKTSILENELLQKKNKALYDEYLNSVLEKDEKLLEYEKKRVADKMRNRTKLEKLANGVDVLLTTSKGTVAMFDQSVFLVQMLPFVFSHPYESAKYAVKAIKYFSDKTAFDKSMATLHSTKLWELIEKTGLAIYEPRSAKTELRNELHGGDKNLWNKEVEVKGKKYSIGQSFERATTSALNNARLYLFMNAVENLYNAGKTFENSEEDFKAAARIANELTGHGKVQEDIAKATNVINKVIWSPKMFASTLNILGLGDITRPVATVNAIARRLGLTTKELTKFKDKGFYTSLTPEQGKFAAKEMSRFIGTGIMILVAAKLASMMNGDDDDKVQIDLDPRSSNFGSMKTDGKTILIFGRFGSVVRTIVQALSGIKVVNGEEQELGKKYGSKTSGDVVFGSFVRGKMTPAAGLTYDFFLNNRKNYYTKEELTPSGIAKQSFVPMSAQDITKDFDRDGFLLGLAETLGKIYGAGIRDDKDFVKKEGGGSHTGVKLKKRGHGGGHHKIKQ